MLLSKHVPSTEKSHSERAGLHLPKRTPMVAKSVNWHHMQMPQRNHLWNLLGFRRRVRRATTAILGRPNDKTPGQKPAVVHKMAPCFCSTVRSEKCRPLPYETATVDNAVEM